MFRAYKYRIYPTQVQKAQIDHSIGVCRLVYNLALETKMYAYKAHGVRLSAIDLCYQLVDLKKDYPWISTIDSQALQASVKKVDVAFKNFFRGGGYPKFKNKYSTQSFQCPNNIRRVDFENETLTISKIKNIPIRLSRRFEGVIKTVTISRTPTGKYFASILVDEKIELPKLQDITPEKSIGLDTGIKTFVVSSDGQSFPANRKLHGSLKRLKCLQRRASRKKKNSKNRKKANKKLAILHEKIMCKRLDVIHDVTNKLTSDNQAVSTIFVEDLNVSGLLRNHKIAQAMSDISLGKFYEILEYKCKWRSINFVKIGRFEPSSKRCSHCGNIHADLKLSDRNWTCETCNTTHDRDENAAKNILWYGLQQTIFSKKTSVGSRKEPVESPTVVGAKKQENVLV